MNLQAPLDQVRHELEHHPLFNSLNSLPRLRLFMQSHVWAVWDFMSLLKRLQRDITCVQVPWKPSGHPAELVRLINQIVVGEESDVDEHGNAISHFDLYLQAMGEVAADTTAIERFIQDSDRAHMPKHVAPFVQFTLQTALEATLPEVAAAFFHGREKLIPGMFEGIIAVLKSEHVPCAKLLYYLERHIEVDGGEHGPMGERCLEILCQGDEALKQAALARGLASLEERRGLWDRTLVLLA